MNAQKHIAAAALAALLVSPLALANEGKDKAMKDSDGNGMVSQTEHEAWADKKFTKLDSDGNGQLSQSELDKPGKDKSQKFADLDADGSGDVSQQEFDDHASSMFARMDSNGDGSLDSSEQQSQRTAMSDDEQSDY